MGVQRRITNYVREMGIRQSTLCRKTGITTDRMSAMFRGKSRMSADEFIAICKAIEKEPNDFMESWEA